jgi:hypothetical protein
LGTAALLRRPHADRDHGKHMVEAAERMEEALGRPGAPGAEGVGGGGLDADGEGKGGEEGKLAHGLLLVLCAGRRRP